MLLPCVSSSFPSSRLVIVCSRLWLTGPDFSPTPLEKKEKNMENERPQLDKRDNKTRKDITRRWARHGRLADERPKISLFPFSTFCVDIVSPLWTREFSSGWLVCVMSRKTHKWWNQSAISATKWMITWLSTGHCCGGRHVLAVWRRKISRRRRRCCKWEIDRHFCFASWLLLADVCNEVNRKGLTAGAWSAREEKGRGPR